VDPSLRISLLVHGFPPYENAGTEQHTSMLVQALKQKGHIVQVISATRSPSLQHATISTTSLHLHRIVNNIPARPLKNCERDPLIRNAIQTLWKSFSPDIIHIQHIQFLSTDLVFPCPTILTLHDAWMWCAAGGQEREKGESICSGATPKKCAPCAKVWAPQLPTRGKALILLAQKIQPILSAATLNTLWEKVPSSVRHSFSQTKTPEKPALPKDAEQRNKALRDFTLRCSIRIAPSEYLAQRAEKHGCGPVQVLRHGVHEHKTHIGGEGFVFVGTIAAHKGPQVVYKAHQESTVSHVPLRFYGPLYEPNLIPENLWNGLKTKDEIQTILQRADALVMGSIWPENAPLVILEAHSVGCPVIAPRIGGIPEIIQDGVDGFLYEAGNITELAQALSKVHTLSPFSSRPPLFDEIVQQHLTLYKIIR
jgi:glycosyltransferase involved in cell wall biosynthesis